MLGEGGSHPSTPTILDLRLLFRLSTLRKMDGEGISAALSPQQSAVGEGFNYSSTRLEQELGEQGAGGAVAAAAAGLMELEGTNVVLVEASCSHRIPASCQLVCCGLWSCACRFMLLPTCCTHSLCVWHTSFLPVQSSRSSLGCGFVGNCSRAGGFFGCWCPLAEPLLSMCPCWRLLCGRGCAAWSGLQGDLLRD